MFIYVLVWKEIPNQLHINVYMVLLLLLDYFDVFFVKEILKTFPWYVKQTYKLAIIFAKYTMFLVTSTTFASLYLVLLPIQLGFPKIGEKDRI